MEPATIVRLVEEPIAIAPLYEAVRAPSCGAVALFVGTSREVHEGRPVAGLSYEAYGPMAEKTLRALADELRARFTACQGVALVHRLGEVPLAEASVVVAVAAPHRAEAFEACRWGIDALKERVPIWKKESYRDGAEPRWVQNHPARPEVTR